MRPGEDCTLIVVPVLARPHRVKPLLESIEEATPEPHRTLFVVDDDDHPERRALEDVEHLVVPGAGHGTYARKINAAYHASTEPLIFSAADDLAFHPGWLTAARRRLTEQIQVVGTNDLLNPRVLAGVHSTHTLFTRRYIETESGVADEPNTVLHEGYLHEFVDDEFIETARARGRFAHAADAVVEHLHPWAKKAKNDSTYRHGRAGRRRSSEVYESRRHLWA